MMVAGSVTIAVSADQRATTAMNVFGAGGVALLAAAAALIAGAAGKIDWLLVSAPVRSALGLFVAAVLCAVAMSAGRFLAPWRQAYKPLSG